MCTYLKICKTKPKIGTYNVGLPSSSYDAEEPATTHSSSSAYFRVQQQKLFYYLMAAGY